MRFAEFEELRTSNLILRKFRYDDTENFYVRVGGSAKVTKYMLWKPHETIIESVIGRIDIRISCEDWRKLC